MKSKERLGIIIVIICGMLWGLSGVVGQLLFENSDISVGWLVSLRMFASGVIILIYSISKQGKKTFSIWKDKKQILSFFIFTVVGLMAVQYTYFAAVEASNAATATVIQYTYPILVLLYTSISMKKLPKLYETCGIIIAFVGVVLIATHGHISSLSISTEALIIGLLSALSFMFYTVYPKKLYEQFGLLTIMSWAFIIGGALLFVLTGCYKTPVTFDNYTIVLTVIITLFGTMIPFVIYGKGVEWLGNVKASLFVTVEPIFSALLAMIIVKTTFKVIDIVGFICIIGAVEVVAIKSAKKKKIE